MRFKGYYTALGLALVVGAPAARAQTVLTREIVDQPIQTVQTTETVRTVRPAPRAARREIVTTRTITRRVIATPTVVARTAPIAPRPLYDVVGPAPIANPDDSPALYDEAVSAPLPPAPVVATPVAQDSYYTTPLATPYIYRYVYEPDRILVIDPSTGVAVQSIPR